MKLWGLNGVGGDRLTIQEAAPPIAGPGEVLVRVSHASLNARDLFLLAGKEGQVHVRDPQAALKLKESPFMPGCDLAGTVVAVGDGVSRFAIGERVISAMFQPGWIDGAPIPPPPGAYRSPMLEEGVLAQLLKRPESLFVKAPESLDGARASTVPIAGGTAWYSLIEAGGLRAGQTVVVQGTGGVSIFGIQIARAHGAQVIVTSSDDAKLERARALGATMLVNRKKQDWAQAVLQLTHGRGADHIIEIAGGPNIGKSLEAIAYGGQISVVGLLEGFDIAGSAYHLMRKRATIRGDGLGHRRAIENFVAAVDSIPLKPIIDAQYRFEDFADALAHLEQGPFGKIVIEVDGA